MKIIILLITCIVLVYGRNLYGMIQSGPSIDFGIIDITTAKLSKKYASLPKDEVITSTDSRLMVPTSDGVFHIGVENIQNGYPGLFTVSIKNGSSNVVTLDTPCLLWQLVYDEVHNILYGVNVQEQNVATLFSIDMYTGKTNLIGTFPLSMSAKLRKLTGQCYEVLGGGTILDTETQLLFLYYSVFSPDGLYFEAVDVRSAKVMNHGIFKYDLASPVFGPSYHTIYSIEIGAGPKYLKYFAVLDTRTSELLRITDCPYWVFYENEAAYDSEKQIYTTIMMMNVSSTATTLVSFDVKTGKIVYQPNYVGAIMWGLNYAGF